MEYGLKNHHSPQEQNQSYFTADVFFSDDTNYSESMSYTETDVESASYNYTNMSTGHNEMELSEEQSLQLQTLNYWINGLVTNIIVILGLTGNILTIIILSQRAMRSSTNYYLSALAVWDSIVLICTGLLIGLPAIPELDSYDNHVFAYVVSFIYPFALIAQTATIWLTVSFTVERYIAVCHPLQAASMCTISRAKIVIIGVSLGSTLYNCPRWFDYRPVTQINPSTNETVIVPIRTLFSQNPIYLQVYFSWLYVPIMCIVPLLVLSVLNMFLILAVRRSQRQRKTMNVKQSRENNVTIMLVSVVIVFIICQVPALVYNLAYAIDNTYVEHSFGYEVLSSLRNFLVTLNSAINFLLYCALGQKFRRIFLHTFCRKCKCYDETYIPMSGVYNASTVINMPTHKGYYNYKSRSFCNRLCTSTTGTNVAHASQNNLVHGNLHPSQESSLISTEIYNQAKITFPKLIVDRNIMTYTPPKDKRNQFHRSQDFIDSEEDEKSGIESLLCESEASDNNCTRFNPTHTANISTAHTPVVGCSSNSSTNHSNNNGVANNHRHVVVPTTRLNGKPMKI